MADIKFRCPECSQKISVDSAAVGVRIDCPSCRSTVIIPPSSDAPVVAITRRKLAVVSGSADGLYKEIEQKQAELAAAIAESQNIREAARQAEAAAQLAEEERGRMLADRDRFRSANEEAAVELEKLRNQLTATASERDALRRRAQDAALVQDGEGQGVVDRFRAELTTAQRERDELSAKLSAVATLRDQLAVMEQERDELIARATKAEDSTDSLRGETVTLRTELAEFQTRLAKAEEQIQDAEAKVSSFTKERDEWKSKATATQQLPAELMAAREDTQKIRSQTGELTRALDAARLDRDQALTVAAEREQALQRLSATAEAARKELAELRA
jgi:chromosome segregation ATPase/DNA-directed RNA polymerase subunit RPC12/RpoP